MTMIISIAAGGALGAVLRHLWGALCLSLLGTSFPWGTLSVNIIGSLFMGLFVSYFALHWSPPPEFRAFLMVGLLGAFTTFSAFSLDVVNLWEKGAFMMALGYMMASVILSIAALAGGLILGRAFFS